MALSILDAVYILTYFSYFIDCSDFVLMRHSVSLVSITCTIFMIPYNMN